jgi:hypothetical protein
MVVSTVMMTMPLTSAYDTAMPATHVVLDCACLQRRFDRKRNVWTQLWQTWFEPLLCLPCYGSWERSRESRRQLDGKAWLLL